MENYVGKFVFVEKKDPAKDSYGNGEYFCVQQTPHTLHAVKLVGGYDGSDLKTFPLVGNNAFDVSLAYQDDEAALIGVSDMQRYSEAPKRGEKLAWCDSVYSRVGENARLAERAIKSKTPAKPAMRPKVACTILVYSDGSVSVFPAE